MTIQKNILVLLAGIPDENLFYIQAGITAYCEKVKRRTAGSFDVSVEYVHTDQTIHTIHGPNSDGGVSIYADPADITKAGEVVEKLEGKNYDAFCLFYNQGQVIGDQPTNPVDTAGLVGNTNNFSIPMSWVGTQPATNPNIISGSAFAAELFFAHENCHSDYAIINAKMGSNIMDRTHEQNPYSNQVPTALTDSSDYFVDLLISLKPFWQYLTSAGQGQDTKPMLTYKFDDSQTVYILTDSATLIGMTAAGLTKTLAGRAQKMVVLPASQRNNYTIVTSAIN